MTLSTSEDRTFETTSYLLDYPQCCQLADPEKAPAFFSSLARCDSISGVTRQMWNVLTDVGIWEWYRIRLPKFTEPFGVIHLPDHLAPIFLIDRQDARRIAADIKERYLNMPISESLLNAYGLNCPDALQREVNIMDFIARQSNHINNHNQYLLVVHNPNSENGG